MSSLIISDERDLQYVWRLMIVQPVASIVSKLNEYDVQNHLGIADYVQHHPDLNVLNGNTREQNAGGPHQRRSTNELPNQTCDSMPEPKIKGDIPVFECENPIELTLPHLRAGLRDMDHYEEW